MPKLTKRLTDSLARKLPAPARDYEIHWCGETPGFGLRVGAPAVVAIQGTENSQPYEHVVRAWIMERRVDGTSKRVTLGKANGPNAISAETARKLMVERSSELQQGIDRVALAREQRKQEQAETTTLAEAVREYVQKKRRSKDGLPLKARTRADYLAMVAEGKTFANGAKAHNGELFALAHKSIYRISAVDIREAHQVAFKRSERRAAYAMQVLRAVLNWFGVKIANNPLGNEVAGRDRIVLPQPRAKGLPIPPERVGAWWKAACAAGGDEVGGSREAADYLRFALITGVRPGEGLGDKYVDGILIRDVDLAGARVVLRDPKNRKDHTVLLSRQALEIVARYMDRNENGQQVAKKLTDRLFSVGDPKKTLAAINKAAGVRVTPHGLRKTFASIADAYVPGNTTKRMINHTDPRDVTAMHYIHRSEAELRRGWQTVADFVEAQAGTEAPQNVVQMPAREVRMSSV
jgi:integrase